MKGALIQLLARGKQDDLFITNNPDISKFRTVYKKINNYVRFECEQTLNTAADFDKTIVCDIDKKGDLLTNCLLEITLPATGETDTSWINAIGIYIIDEVRLKIGGITIDKFGPEYIDAYYKHSIKFGSYTAYTEMIKSFYGYQNNTNTGTNKLFIPLPFWFTKSIGNAFPLISLGYMDIKIEIDFKSLDRCLFNDTTSISVSGLSISDCRIYTEMIYLPKEERCLYLNTKEYDYLIEQKQYFTYSVDAGQVNKNIKFSFNHPVKELMWIYRDNYHKNRNSWNIYSLNDGSDEIIPIEDVTLTFNGLDRISKRHGNFFRLVQPFRHHESAIGDYYYFYSFCDNPDEFQPSGYVNMSLIDNANLQLTFNNNINSGELLLYAINYNHLKIKNGMAGLLFN